MPTADEWTSRALNLDQRADQLGRDMDRLRREAEQCREAAQRIERQEFYALDVSSSPSHTETKS